MRFFFKYYTLNCVQIQNFVTQIKMNGFYNIYYNKYEHYYDAILPYTII